MDCSETKLIFQNGLPITVNCGKCIPCLGLKRADWVYRLHEEHRHSDGALFITLTYHPKYLPDELKKRHLQLFIKRVRKLEVGRRIRYFAVGEYGSKRKRPHYHLLLFNCDLSGQTIIKAWRHAKSKEPLGIVHFGKVSEASIAYCTKYIVQPELVYPDKSKPFALMSRAYGIGGKYLSDDMVAWHRNGQKNYCTRYGIKQRLPRFYKEKIWHRKKVTKPTYVDGFIVPDRIYQHPDREAVSCSSKTRAFEKKEKERRYYQEEYGEYWQDRMTEFRNAVIQRVKVKVAFSQIL